MTSFSQESKPPQNPGRFNPVNFNDPNGLLARQVNNWATQQASYFNSQYTSLINDPVQHITNNLNRQFETLDRAVQGDRNALNAVIGGMLPGGGVAGTVRNVGAGIESAAAGAAREALSESRALTTFYPPNNGFIGATRQVTLQEGQLIDRFGGTEYSRFFSPEGTPAGARALPPGVAEQPLRTFEVQESFTVESGTVAPAFGQLGLGTQLRSSMQLGELLQGGYLREINP